MTAPSRQAATEALLIRARGERTWLVRQLARGMARRKCQQLLLVPTHLAWSSSRIAAETAGLACPGGSGQLPRPAWETNADHYRIQPHVSLGLRAEHVLTAPTGVRAQLLSTVPQAEWPRKRWSLKRLALRAACRLIAGALLIAVMLCAGRQCVCLLQMACSLHSGC